MTAPFTARARQIDGAIAVLHELRASLPVRRALNVQRGLDVLHKGRQGAIDGASGRAYEDAAFLASVVLADRRTGASS